MSLDPKAVTETILDRNSMDRDAVETVVKQIMEESDELFPFRKCAECGELLDDGAPCPSCGCEEDAPSYREHQQEIIVEGAIALWIEGYDNIMIEGPVGIGKSAINYTLARMAKDAFYTTPQKSLRNQLQNDEDLDVGMRTLRGRADYTCGATGKDCSSCPINTRNDKSCKDQPDCTYWNAKMRAIDSHIAATTFAYLIVDKNIPTYSTDGDRLSFSNRDLLIVDECHTLEEQVASMFAGFSVSPWTLPPEIYEKTGREIERRVNRGEEIDHHSDVRNELSKLAERAKRYKNRHQNDESKADAVQDCERFIGKYEWFKGEVAEGREWVVDVEDVNTPKGGKTKSLKMKPIKVDNFLKNFVWSRGEKRILSTATMPYRDNPDKWFDRLGLEGDTHVIRKDMPFPKENRPIHTDTIIDKFSGGGDKENWGQIVEDVTKLGQKHEGEKGLIHTASYKRANRLAEALGHRAMAHDRDKDAEEMVKKWQNSSYQILCSPSMMEGVDLMYDMCRWQVLLKVPYPDSHHDNRVAYLLDEKNDWPWYFQTTGLQVYQSVGRAVRAADDKADFYVLDKSFQDIISKTKPPNWVTEALVG